MKKAINNDKHIWQRVINSSFKTLYIDLHLDKLQFTDKQGDIMNALKIISHDDIANKNIEFFTTKENDIWS
jgi:hypothetical protein